MIVTSAQITRFFWMAAYLVTLHANMNKCREKMSPVLAANDAQADLAIRDECLKERSGYAT